MGFESRQPHGEQILLSRFPSLVRSMRPVVSKYPDDTELSSLRFPPGDMDACKYWLYGHQFTNHPQGWAEFYNKLEPNALNYLSGILTQALMGGLHTLGSIRNSQVKDLLAAKMPGSNQSRLTQEEAEFLIGVFRHTYEDLLI